jgi:hypothetical protein
MNTLTLSSVSDIYLIHKINVITHVESIFIEYTYFGLPTAVKAIQIDVYYSESMYSFRIQDAVVHMLKVWTWYKIADSV